MVIEQLLIEKVSTITCFPPNIQDTDNDIRKMIQGTAVLPGWSGLWRGPGFFGPLPELFRKLLSSSLDITLIAGLAI
jgi:hypothetical protein